MLKLLIYMDIFMDSIQTSIVGTYYIGDLSFVLDKKNSFHNNWTTFCQNFMKKNLELSNLNSNFLISFNANINGSTRDVSILCLSDLYIDDEHTNNVYAYSFNKNNAKLLNSIDYIRNTSGFIGIIAFEDIDKKYHDAAHNSGVIFQLNEKNKAIELIKSNSMPTFYFDGSFHYSLEANSKNILNLDTYSPILNM